MGPESMGISFERGEAEDVRARLDKWLGYRKVATVREGLVPARKMLGTVLVAQPVWVSRGGFCSSLGMSGPRAGGSWCRRRRKEEAQKMLPATAGLIQTRGWVVGWGERR